jgi:hypothetical protein
MFLPGPFVYSKKKKVVTNHKCGFLIIIPISLSLFERYSVLLPADGREKKKRRSSDQMGSKGVFLI